MLEFYVSFRGPKKKHEMCDKASRMFSCAAYLSRIETSS